MSTRWVRGATLALGVLVVSTGCEKTAVKTSVSPCFRVLPQAHAAVASQGAFVDVARRKGGSIYPSSGGTTPAPSAVIPTAPVPTGAVPGPGGPRRPAAPNVDPNDPRRDVCIVAYRGSFDATRIPLLRGPNQTGKYAVVVVGVRSQQVRAVVLTDRLPSALHRH